jgi:antitoxin (DNA-binding transcriptional repressor) of toxin-antitoxin stability system
MKKAGIAELKKNLPRYLDHVKGGEIVVVVDRNQPIAQIIPLEKNSRSAATRNGRLARLERKGLIRRGSSEPDRWLLKHRPVKIAGSVLQDLLDERRSGW